MPDRATEVQTEGSIAFDRFLEENSISLRAAAANLGVTDPTVLHWRIGKKRPEKHHRDRITVWTKGAIHPDCWDTEAERTGLRRVEPFPASGTGG